MDLAFVVYAPRFNVNSGGAIVLYDLARRLKGRGFEVTIWVNDRPVFSLDYLENIGWSPVRLVLRWFRHFRNRPKLPYGLRATKKIDRKKDVVIYPEITSKNPLGATRVVRWILYFPGVLSRTPVYGTQDLFFLFSEDFANELVPTWAEKLSVPAIIPKVYRKFNCSERKGSLVLFRKGVDRVHLYHPVDSYCVDGKSHEELCELFNSAATLYSYDLYTAYTLFAAICGCIPIVVPQENLSEEDWRPNIRDRYGIAYGESRVQFALETRDLLLAQLTEGECECNKQIDNFLLRVRDAFEVNEEPV